MCLAIAKSKDIIIEKKYLLNGFRENKDGAGFAVAKDGKIIMRKGFFTFKSFWKCYREFQKYPAIIHFRDANVGLINSENCHPFLVAEGLAKIHNGTINIQTDGTKSDTRTFCEQICRNLYKDNKDFLKNPQINWFISKSIGNSKLAFIDAKGEITIINKERGEEFKGVWYSNKDYLAWPKKESKTAAATKIDTNLTYNQARLYGMCG